MGSVNHEVTTNRLMTLTRQHLRWFIIDVLTLGPDWALEIVAWFTPTSAERLGGDVVLLGG